MTETEIYVSVQYEALPYHSLRTGYAPPPSDEAYTYVTDDATIQADDFVVVHVRNKLAIGRVTAVGVDRPHRVRKSKVHGEVRTPLECKWVVCKIDLTEHTKREERRAERHRLRAELDARLAAVTDRERYEALASKDPAAAQLLAQLSRLERGEE